MARDDSAARAGSPASGGGSVAHLLHRAQQAGADLHAGLLAGAGLTVRQLAVLQTLAAPGAAMSQSGLVAATGIDRSTLAEMVARMEARGLLVRSSAENDRRAKTVRLADAGRAALEAATSLAASADTALLKRLPKKHRELFLELLQRITVPVEERKAAKQARRQKKDRARPPMPGAALETAADAATDAV